MNGVIGKYIAMNNIFKRNVQQLETPCFCGIVRQRITVLSYFENVVEKIGANKTTGSENKYRSFKFFYFFLVDRYLIKHSLIH